MAEFSDETHLALNRRGLIPGPEEEEEAFIERVNYCLHLIAHLPESLKINLSKDAFQEKEALHEASIPLKKLYDSAPDWVPIVFSNDKLPFWHGGCAWIFQMTEKSPTSSLIQLRKALKNSASYLGIYKKTELLTHELSHVGRMMFQEPQFEELLAYQTANTSFRRWLGPLVQSSWESALFLLSLFVLIVFDVFLLSMERTEAYFLAFWLKIIPLMAIAAAVLRLWKRHQIFASCLKNLKECVGDEKAKAVAYRLRDSEINAFSKMTSKEIKDYAVSKMTTELRWHVIAKAYFDRD